MKLITLITLICYVVLTVDCYKILGLFSHQGKSHFDVFAPLLRALAEKGHEVTVISQFPIKNPPASYKEVVFKGPHVGTDMITFQEILTNRVAKYVTPYMLGVWAEMACENSLASKQVQDFMKINQTFDLIIAEFFNSDCFLGFVHKFKAPLIGLSSCTIMPWTNSRFANPTHPAYIPNNLMDYSDELNFFERVENTVLNVIHEWSYDFFMNKPTELIARKYFGDDLPPLSEIAKNASLLLVNTHFSLNRPRPLVPAVVEVSGMFLRKPNKLPANIEKWINESAHGVIYFSLGSLIKGHTFPEEKRRAFLRAFAGMPQRVLWKWENDTMPEQPDNVMIQKWMPQFDILCHPNVKAFISHGGLLGTTEAVHCGVPVIVMPQFGDQHTNARALEASGGGVILQLKDVDEEKVRDALKTVLEPSFRQKAKELSARWRDRPLPPLDTAIYWVEYIARHKGGHHMRTAAVGMPFYKYLLLDVVAFLAAVLFISVLACYYVTRKIFRAIFNSGEKVKKS